MTEMRKGIKTMWLQHGEGGGGSSEKKQNEKKGQGIRGSFWKVLPAMDGG
jgi:hypothetical protein